MGKVVAVNSLQEFQDIIKNKDKYSVFDFWAEWCGPCRTISPIFEKLAEEADDSKISFYKVDVDDQTDIAQEVGIRAMPTFMLFKDGEKVNTAVGAIPDQLKVPSPLG